MGASTFRRAEELAAANADQDALAAALDTYGVTYTRSVDEYGFVLIDMDWNDAVAQAVADSFWAERYRPEPIPADELARMTAENDRLAAALDGAGVGYTRQTDRWGNEWIEYDYEDPKAQEVVDAYYAELYPPVPLSAEELATMRAENDRIAAAFDAAGVAYTRMTDETGWEWLEWDFEDADTVAAVDAVYAELYPIDPTIDPCALVDDAAVREDAPVGDLPVGEASPTPLPAPAADAAESTIAIDPIEGGLSEEQVAQRAADLAALSAAFDAAGVQYWAVGEDEWASLTFDFLNEASIPAVQSVLALRAG